MSCMNDDLITKWDINHVLIFVSKFGSGKKYLIDDGINDKLKNARFS